MKSDGGDGDLMEQVLRARSDMSSRSYPGRVTTTEY